MTAISWKVSMRRALRIVAFLSLALTAAAPTLAQQDNDANVAAAAAQCRADPNVDLRALPAPERTALITCLQKANAAAQNARLPIKIDEITTLTSVSASGIVFTYHYTVEVDAASLPQEAISGLISDTRESACAKLRSIEVGAGFRYVWIDGNGAPIAETTVDSC